MSLVGALGSALSGMRAAQIGIQVAGNNIANASDENYTRKSAVRQPINSTDGLGGVEISGYTRSTNASLQRQLISAITSEGRTSTQTELFTQTKDAFGITSDLPRLSSFLDDFTSAWQSYAAAPETQVRQNEVIRSANSFTAELRRVAGAVEALDREIISQTQEAVDDINNILANIQTLNNQVSSAVSTGQNAGDLQDQRDKLVLQLAEYMDIRIIEGDVGRIKLATPTGFNLLELEPITLSYNGTTVLSNGATDVADVLANGKLQALLYFRQDNSPTTASSDTNREVIRKLRDQLETLADSFLTTTGTPTTFAAAYDNATARTGEQDTGFFTGTGRFDIALNASIANGTATIKSGAANAVIDALYEGSRSFTADGLSTSSTTYVGYVNSIFSTLGQSAQSAEDAFNIETTTRQAYRERLTNETGVNVDEEVISLTQLQNSYAASARVISVVTAMLDTLINEVR